MTSSAPASIAAQVFSDKPAADKAWKRFHEPEVYGAAYKRTVRATTVESRS